ncbi:MAG: type IX secretion system membrane protein PorP/SprF [Saprospiraceae bacterium]
MRNSLLRLISMACLTVAFFSSAQAQDPIFSQFFAAPLQLNPGFAGSAFAPRMGVIYRNQWSGFGGAYRTYGAYYEQSVERLNSGLGIYVEGDNAGQGILRTNTASVAYAYNLQFGRDYSLRLGLDAGIRQVWLDWNKLVFPDQLDPIQGIQYISEETQPDDLNRTSLDLGAGLLFLSPHFWFGLGMKHLNRPNETLLSVNNIPGRGLPQRLTLHAGMDIPLGKNNKQAYPTFISPNFLFAQQGPFRQLNAGAYLGINRFFAGAWFRHAFHNADAAILHLGFREGIFKLGLSYDVNVSGLAAYSGGTYEMSLTVMLDQSENLKRKRAKSQINNCLGMFQ